VVFQVRRRNRKGVSAFPSMTVQASSRVSTDGQSLEAQDAALRAAGAERVYAEKQSGIKQTALHWRAACAG
jgi:DNA invertase Pin-like site-specific DNA recombinase